MGNGSKPELNRLMKLKHLAWIVLYLTHFEGAGISSSTITNFKSSLENAFWLDDKWHADFSRKELLKEENRIVRITWEDTSVKKHKTFLQPHKTKGRRPENRVFALSSFQFICVCFRWTPNYVRITAMIVFCVLLTRAWKRSIELKKWDAFYGKMEKWEQVWVWADEWMKMNKWINDSLHFGCNWMWAAGAEGAERFYE